MPYMICLFYHPGKYSVNGVGEAGFVFRAKGRGTAGLYTAVAKILHEVAHASITVEWGVDSKLFIKDNNKK